MIRIIIFNLLMFGTCFYALWKGTRDARIISVTCLAASTVTFLVAGKYSGVETMILAVDLVVLGAFLYVAMRSDRFWPLWIAGFHVTTIFGHVLRMMSSDLVPIAYAVALRLWAYPELIILGVAVWRSQQRRRLDPITA